MGIIAMVIVHGFGARIASAANMGVGLLYPHVIASVARAAIAISTGPQNDSA
ncbi:hypothetical protein [Trinickia dabaoshanensis]|uniref:hypothetical protein n=1 Tax=Trinickia dabaoshanensis TaxID=564714 RepID=UPI001304EAB4|nr:hypothetical protein [Trinickia dabaoshanensis]